MEIKLKRMTIRELSEGYNDAGINGVTSMKHTLNIRPEYQREFVYKDKKRDAVMDSVMNNFPINTMFFGLNDDGTMEVIDGQQRLISICSYIHGDYAINYRYWVNLTSEEQKRILDYDLITIYICRGSTNEKLDWFHRINTQSEPLNDQELRNSTYTGPWLADAKRYFSKPNGVALNVGEGYIKGAANRQEILQLALDWVSKRDDITIEEYMAKHQHDNDCKDMWEHYKKVIKWVKDNFTVYRKEMKDVNWGDLWVKALDNPLNPPQILEELIKELMMDDDVTNKKGIYRYVIESDEKYLSIRAFTPTQKRAAYERQNGICPKCQKHFKFEEMQGDHLTPWSKGGRTVSENCVMLCADCNRKKSNV